MPSIFPKNHLSKDPQTCNALIGQMRLNMHGIKCMGLLFSQVCIKLQQWWLYPKIPQKPSATEKKRAARWEPWRTPALESPVLFRQDMEASKKTPPGLEKQRVNAEQLQE